MPSPPQSRAQHTSYQPMKLWFRKQLVLPWFLPRGAPHLPLQLLLQTGLRLPGRSGELRRQIFGTPSSRDASLLQHLLFGSGGGASLNA